MFKKKTCIIAGFFYCFTLLNKKKPNSFELSFFEKEKTWRSTQFIF